MSYLHRHYSMRLQQWDYSQPAAYFITICTKQRLPILGNVVRGKFYPSSYGQIVQHIWSQLSNRYHCRLDAFVVMPDHIHGIIIVPRFDVGAIHELPLHRQQYDFINHDRPEYHFTRRRMIIPKMIGRLKMQSSKMVNQLRNTPGQTVWQRDYYERIIRTPEQLHKVRLYITNNPKNYGAD